MKLFSEFKHAVIAMATIFAAACAETPLDIPVSSEATCVAENPDYEVIRSLELQTEGIVEKDDLYVVEGDIVVSKEYIEELKNEPKTRQAYYYRAIPRDVVRNINVYIDPVLEDGSPTSWYKAAINAIGAWNNLPNCEIGFNVVGNPYPRHVIIRRNAQAGIAWANLPKGECPGEYIEIGNDANSYDLARKTYVMVHELGHILRFKHSNYKTNDADKPQINDTKDIAGTPDGEFESVMYSHGARRPWNTNSFTAGDLAAAQAMYGIPIWSREIAGSPMCGSANPATYTLYLGSNLRGINVSWYVNNTFERGGTSLSFKPTSLPPGQVTLKAVVNYGGVNYEAYKVITVINVDVSGPDYPLFNNNVTYSTPTTLSAGVSFNNWTISSNSGYTVTGGTSGRNLTIKFTAYGTYTLTANYTLPNGSSCAVTKQITVTSPTPPATPILKATGEQVYWGYWVRPGTTATVYIDGNYDSFATYEWSTGGLTFYQLTGPYAQRTNIPNYYGNEVSRYEIGCRAYKNGRYSDWSYLWLCASHSRPQSPYNMFNKTGDGEDMKNDTDLESEEYTKADI